MNKILRTIRPENQWPGVKGFRVEIEVKMPKKEPIKAEVFMSEEDFKINMFIQGLIESDKIVDAQANALLQLVEDLGQAKYSEGYDEGSASANELNY